MTNGIVSGSNNIAPVLDSSGTNFQPPTDTSFQRNPISAGALENSKNKGANVAAQNAELSENIETVLNKLSSNVSSDKIKSDDTEVVENIEQNIGSILSSTANSVEEDGNKNKPIAGLNDLQTSEVKQGLVDILNIANDVLEAQTEDGVDESFVLSLIEDLLSMLESYMGSNQDLGGSPTQNSSDSIQRFELLINLIGLVRDDLIDISNGRFSDVINLVDQQLEEQRYRAREARNKLTQRRYLDSLR